MNKKRESLNTIKRDYMMDRLPLLFPQRISISIPQKRKPDYPHN